MTRTASAASAATPQTNDPWALASGSTYDVDNIYTRASDDKGHSNLMHVPVSTNLYGQIRALVEGKDIPEYKTNADVVRDALIHRMRYLSDRLSAQGNVTTLAMIVDAEVSEAEADRIATDIAQWERLIDKLDGLLDKLIAAGDYDTAWHLIDRNSDVEYMTPPFQDRMARVIERHTSKLRTMANRLPVIEDAPYDDDVVIGLDGRRTRNR